MGLAVAWRLGIRETTCAGRAGRTGRCWHPLPSPGLGAWARERLDLLLQPQPCHPLPRWLAYVLLLLLELLVCLFTLLGLAKQSRWLVIV